MVDKTDGKFMIEIKNPSAFMTQEFVIKELCKKYSKAQVYVRLLNQIPEKVYLSFSSKEEMEKFGKDFRGKAIDPKMT